MYPRTTRNGSSPKGRAVPVCKKKGDERKEKEKKEKREKIVRQWERRETHNLQGRVGFGGAPRRSLNRWL